HRRGCDETHRRADDRRHGQLDDPDVARDPGPLCDVALESGQEAPVSQLFQRFSGRDSRHTMTASPPATMRPITLTHIVMTRPLITTSHPKISRSTCRAAGSEKKPIAMVVNGFT